MKHFKLTDETIVVDGTTLFRIELTKDCNWGKEGDKGGWVENKTNLYGNAWVSGDAWVFGDAWDKSPLQIKGTKHFFSMCTKNIIKIGCIEKTIQDWCENFEAIGLKNNYTQGQINEYGLYINLAKELYI